MAIKKICRDCKYSIIHIEYGSHKGYKCKLTGESIDLQYTCKYFEFTEFIKKELLKKGEIIL